MDQDAVGGIVTLIRRTAQREFVEVQNPQPYRKNKRPLTLLAWLLTEPLGRENRINYSVGENVTARGVDGHCRANCNVAILD